MQARELLQGLLQLEPSSTRGLGMLGTLEWKAGKRKLARQYLVAGIKADPSHVANLHSLARLELEEGHLQEARELFARGKQLEPNNVYVLQVGPFLVHAVLFHLLLPFLSCCIFLLAVFIYLHHTLCSWSLTTHTSCRWGPSPSLIVLRLLLPFFLFFFFCSSSSSWGCHCCRDYIGLRGNG